MSAQQTIVFGINVKIYKKALKSEKVRISVNPDRISSDFFIGAVKAVPALAVCHPTEQDAIVLTYSTWLKVFQSLGLLR